MTVLTLQEFSGSKYEAAYTYGGLQIRRLTCNSGYSLERCQSLLIEVGKSGDKKRFCPVCVSHSRLLARRRFLDNRKAETHKLTKLCPVCGVEFSATRSSKKTCSDRCRKIASLQKIELPSTLNRAQAKKLRKIEGQIAATQEIARFQSANGVDTSRCLAELVRLQQELSKFHNKL